MGEGVHMKKNTAQLTDSAQIANNSVISSEKYLQQYGIQKSYLTYHNFGSKIVEYLEIGMPYMIMYESLDTKTGRTVSFEFTENSKNYLYSSIHELEKLGERPLHTHDFYELTVVLSGEIKICIENEVQTYHMGECCLCNRNIHHKEIMDTDFELILFMLKEDYIKKALEQDILYDENGCPYTRSSLFHMLFAKNKEISFYTAKEYIDFRINSSFHSEPFYAIINALINEFSEYRAGRRHLLMGYICRFINLLENEGIYQIQSHRAVLSKEEDLVYRISLLLEQRHGIINRQELEEALNYNGDYMNRVIKKHFGYTLSEYARNFRMQEAAKLLSHTSLSISEICSRLGYSNYSFFNRIFQRRYGMSPGAYRQSCGTGSD